MKNQCPSTKLFKKLKINFTMEWEKSEADCNRECIIEKFSGRISNKVFKKLEKDTEMQDDLSRGVSKDISILFADIRGFTSRTANMAPDKIVKMLDLFIPEMIHIIVERHKGMVDKLLGDGIMALFGHPYQTEMDAIQAIYSAIDMQQAASAMGEVLEIMGYDPIEIGVGINTGQVLICELGTESYRETTVIGSPVNTAAKMEDIALANEIVIPETTLTDIDSQKSDLVSYFERKPDNIHKIDSYYFDWIRYLNDNKREYEDWEIKP